MNFISWIEIIIDGVKQYFYLTDKEIFSEAGREKLMLLKKEEILSHNAIKIFYGIGMNVGKHCMFSYFWRTESLPTEIAEKIKNFDSYWGRCFERGYFCKNNYQITLLCAPKEWKERFAEKLVKDIENGVSENDFTLEDRLTVALKYCPEEYKALVSEAIIKKQSTKENLKYLINCAPPEFKEKACDAMISKHRLDIFDLKSLLNICPESRQEKVFELLKKEKFTEKDTIMISSEKWRQLAKNFLTNNPENNK